MARNIVENVTAAVEWEDYAQSIGMTDLNRFGAQMGVYSNCMDAGLDAEKARELSGKYVAHLNS